MDSDVSKVSLRVTNIVMTGRIPIEHKFDFADFIRNLEGWLIINEEISPIIQKQFHRKTISHRTHRRHNITVSIWPSGAINIVGLRSVEEGHETLCNVMDELRSGGTQMDMKSNKDG